MAQKIVEAKISNVESLIGFAEEELEMRGASVKMISQVSIAIDEIFTNIASYAYPDGKGSAALSIEDAGNDSIRLIFSDSGIAYDPLAKEDPDVTLSAEERGIGGLGIFMVKKLMDGMSYERKNGQNILTLEKKLTAASGKKESI